MASAPPSAVPSSTFSLALRALKLDTAADLDPHVAPLRASTAHTAIYLNGNTLGAPAATALAPLLAAQSTLEHANLADLFTGRLLHEIPPALASLLPALNQCPRLQTVDLSDNAFGLNTVDPLAAFLRAHLPLRHLVLNNNGLGPAAGARVAEALTELAARKAQARAEGTSTADEIPELETVVCGRNRLESGSMAAWAAAFAAHPGLRTVRLAQDGIRPAGLATVLTEGLARCAELEVLDLQDNTLTAVGGRALARVVGGWTKLRELGVGDCVLGGPGARALFRALGQGGAKPLRKLSLQYDEINGRSFAELVQVVKGGNLLELRRVEVNGNKFAEDAEAVEELGEILRERREKAGGEAGDEEWGIDELDEMESDNGEEDEDEGEDEDEEDEEEAEEEKEAKAEKVLQEADQAENEKVAQKKDADVDNLAEALGKRL